MMIPKGWKAAIGAVILTSVLATGAAFATESETPTDRANKLSPGVEDVVKQLRSLRQSRLEQLKAEMNALIDQAVTDGKITAEEAARLKAAKTRLHHDRGHDPRGFLKRFGRNATEAEVRARLNQAVKNGRITQEQADQMLKRWQEWKAKQTD